MDANKCIDELLKQLEDERRNVRSVGEFRASTVINDFTEAFVQLKHRPQLRKRLLILIKQHLTIAIDVSLHPSEHGAHQPVIAASLLDEAQNPSGVLGGLFLLPVCNVAVSLTDGNKSSAVQCQHQMARIQNVAALDVSAY
ncbi:hypothetical protein KUCAC02_036124, partial [Chaenocephalus aceratus]